MTGGGNLVRYERYRKAPRTPRSAHARYYYTRSLVLDSPEKRRGPPRTRCQSAPKIMDSHSRSASPREPMRPQIRPPSPPAPAAFDNRAYQHDEADPNHNESFTSNGPSNGPNGTQNGHKPNGDTKLEAVNLELINMTPKNGTKKDTAVDMNASNPYDEYFVPVNEHRKFMRGEKLYVTADKRGEKGGCKRPLCWTLLVLLVAAIVAVIVLAATGILFSGSPSALEQYNTTVTSARAFGGVVHDHSGHDHSDHDHSGHDHSDHDHSEHDHSGHDHSGHDHSDHDHSGHDHSEHDHSDHSTTTNSTETQHGPETQSDQANIHNIVSDESDMSIYVPRTLEGELRIDNEEYSPALDDTDSDEYREFVNSFTDALKRAVFDRSALDSGEHDISVEVIQLRKGSVVVTYRIHWTPKHTAPNTELLTSDSLKTKLDDYLEKYNRMINVYHVAEEKVVAKPVLDICQIDNNECEHGCEFNKATLEFTCTCPHGQMLDMSNPKQCIMILENSFPLEPMGNKAHEFKHTSVDSNPSTTKPIADEETPSNEEVHIANENFDWKETKQAAPETTTESETDMNFSHIFGHGDERMNEAPAPEPNAEPEPSAEPKPEPEPAADSDAEPAVEPIAEPTAEPIAEPTAEPMAEPTVEPIAEPTAEPSAEPAAEPTAEPKAESVPEPTSVPEPAPAAEPTSLEDEVNLRVIPSPTTKPTPEPTTEPEPKSEPEPTPEPKPTSEPEQEPKSEPKSKPEPTSESEPISEPEPTSEPSVSVEPTTVKVTFSTQNTDHESNSDEKSTLLTNEEYDGRFNDEMETSTTRVSISEPNIINEPSYEPEPDIISIYSNRKHQSVSESADNSETTTENNEWLELRKPQNEKQSTLESISPKTGEQRSFKSIEVFGEEPSTTEKAENRANELIVPNNVVGREDDKTEVFTNAPLESRTTTTTKTSHFDIAVKENNDEVLTTEMPAQNNAEKSLNLFTNSLGGITTQDPKSEDEHSIMQQNFKNFDEKRLMDALNKKGDNLTETTTERQKSEDGVDITFDTISNLFNRSSKSIENQTHIQQPTEKMQLDTTTESDWLSETVTEMKYEDAMNKLGKHETTEIPAAKFEEIVSGGKHKDDFEPDYLNNMSSNNNKMSEQDEPMYGLAQDYDSEDSRVKRVNSEKEGTTEAPIEVDTNKMTVTEESALVEPTTVVEYIYKSAETTTQDNIMVSSSTQAPMSEETKPAPVWEESEGDVSVKELPKPTKIQEETTTTQLVMIDDIVVPWELTSTTTTEITSTQVTEASSSSLMPDSTTSSSITTVSGSDTESQNTTQVNNLNVNIYEIPSHNSSVVIKDANAQLTDFEDHETEMNPFLPEVENNKVLVKKLQEGHDIEPNNFTESQNENTDEHSKVSEATATQTESDKAVITTTAVTEENATFDEIMKSSQGIKTESGNNNALLSATEHKEKIPISTFLLDTDDLDVGKSHIAEHKTTLAMNNLENGEASSSTIANDDSEYLSVVPIEEERLEEKDALKKSYSSESMQELNDISDSPKKSDRRTLDETKFDSVQNNEA